jgi:hypothetical protein
MATDPMRRTTSNPATRGHAVASDSAAQSAGTAGQDVINRAAKKAEDQALASIILGIATGRGGGEIKAVAEGTPVEPEVDTVVGGVPRVTHTNKVNQTAPVLRTGQLPTAREEAAFGTSGEDRGRPWHRPDLNLVRAQDAMISTPRGLTAEAQPGDRGDFDGVPQRAIAEVESRLSHTKSMRSLMSEAPVSRTESPIEAEKQGGMSGRLNARAVSDLAEKGFSVETGEDGGEYVTGAPVKVTKMPGR